MQIIARIEIPKHIRQVELSKKQRPIYFEWNGESIISQKRKIKLPRTFFSNIKVSESLNGPIFGPYLSDLKSEFCIAQIPKKNGIYKKNLVIYHRSNNNLPKITSDSIVSNYWKQFEWILYRQTLLGYEPVIANHTKAGKPNVYLINGQDIYSGKIREHMLGFVMDSIKKCYKDAIGNLPVITDYPVDILCEIHDTINNAYVKSTKDVGQHWDIDNYAFPYLKAFPDFLVAEGILKDDDRLHLPQNIPAIFIPIDNHADRKLVFIISKTERPEIINNKIYQEYHNPKSKEDTGLIKLDL